MDNRAPDVVTLGEARVLFAATTSGPLEAVTQFSKHAAGAETNVATGLARMGLRTAWVSRLGDDSLGRYLHTHMKAQGIDCSHVQVLPGGKTAFMFKTRQDDGRDPQIEYHRSGSAASRFGPADLDLLWLSSARHLHVSGVFPAVSDTTLAATRLAMKTMREAGKTISFDPNLRPTLWASPQRMATVMDELASMADWVLPGWSEAQQLTGLQSLEDIAAHYRSKGASRVIIKCGAEGAWYDDGTQRGSVKACPVERVIDTVGAGDAFAVGVITGLLEGLDTAAATRRGNWMGARAVQVRGDSEGLPTRAEWQVSGMD
jgi:dehydrogluconokinase